MGRTLYLLDREAQRFARLKIIGFGEGLRWHKYVLHTQDRAAEENLHSSSVTHIFKPNVTGELFKHRTKPYHAIRTRYE